MIDLRAARADPERFRAALARRGAAEAFDELLAADERWHALVPEVDELRASQKIDGRPTPEQIEELKTVKERLRSLEEQLATAEEARDLLRDAPGCQVIDKHEDGGYITPHEAAGEDATYISRIRVDPTVENGLAFWCVSDNLRKGAALNAVQIAELLVARKLIVPKQKAA